MKIKQIILMTILLINSSMAFAQVESDKEIIINQNIHSNKKLHNENYITLKSQNETGMMYDQIIEAAGSVLGFSPEILKGHINVRRACSKLASALEALNKIRLNQTFALPYSYTAIFPDDEIRLVASRYNRMLINNSALTENDLEDYGPFYIIGTGSLRLRFEGLFNSACEGPELENQSNINIDSRARVKDFKGNSKPADQGSHSVIQE